MPKTSSKDIAQSEITGTTLASVLGLSLRRIQQLAAEGVIPKTEAGFGLADAVQAYVRWIKEAQQRAAPSDAKERLLDARATQIELANKLTEHELVNTEEAVAALDEIVGAFRSELSGLPARLTRNLDQRDHFTREVDGLCGRVAALFDRRAGELRSQGAVTVPAEDGEDAE